MYNEDFEFKEFEDKNNIEVMVPDKQYSQKINNEDEISVTVSVIITHNNILNALLYELKPINFHEKVKLGPGEKLDKAHYVILTVEEILSVAKEKHWSMCINAGQVYLFNGAFWKNIAKEDVRGFLSEAAEKLGVDKFDARYHLFGADLFKQFMSVARLPRPEKGISEVLINLTNGTFVFNANSQRLKFFDRSDFLTYQLPFIHDETAQITLFQSYLDKVLPDKNHQLVLAEFVAYVFVKQKTLKLEKSLILFGTGANGKSVFFEIITALLGSENVSNYSLQSLTNDTGYQRAKLQTKLLNYASEISTKMDSTVFKQLVSGEPVEARLPYGEPFIIDDYAKLIFNTNELPKDVEHNEAFFRRFIIVPFNVTIPEAERDPELARKIINTELPGVFNWVLEGLKRLLTQKNFTISETLTDVIKVYKQQSDTVQLFIIDEDYELDVNAKTQLKQVYDNYKKYCLDYGYKVLSNRSFSDRLKNLGYSLTRMKHGNVVDIKKKPFILSALSTPATNE